MSLRPGFLVSLRTQKATFQCGSCCCVLSSCSPRRTRPRCAPGPSRPAGLTRPCPICPLGAPCLLSWGSAIASLIPGCQAPRLGFFPSPTMPRSFSPPPPAPPSRGRCIAPRYWVVLEPCACACVWRGGGGLQGRMRGQSIVAPACCVLFPPQSSLCPACSPKQCAWLLEGVRGALLPALWGGSGGRGWAAVFLWVRCMEVSGFLPSLSLFLPL